MKSTKYYSILLFLLIVFPYAACTTERVKEYEGRIISGERESREVSGTKCIDANCMSCANEKYSHKCIFCDPKWWLLLDDPKDVGINSNCIGDCEPREHAQVTLRFILEETKTNYTWQICMLGRGCPDQTQLKAYCPKSSKICEYKCVKPEPVPPVECKDQNCSCCASKTDVNSCVQCDKDFYLFTDSVKNIGIEANCVAKCDHANYSKVILSYQSYYNHSISNQVRFCFNKEGGICPDAEEQKGILTYSSLSYNSKYKCSPAKDKSGKSKIAWWIYLVSIIDGLVLIVGIIFLILYCMKRKKRLNQRTATGGKMEFTISTDDYLLKNQETQLIEISIAQE